jgi:hypothetical protein
MKLPPFDTGRAAHTQHQKSETNGSTYPISRVSFERATPENEWFPHKRRSKAQPTGTVASHPVRFLQNGQQKTQFYMQNPESPIEDRNTQTQCGASQNSKRRGMLFRYNLA